ncbi:MAG TPA: L-rhamnose isomerase [Candidatus Hydrogenedentes bacterium]|nr:L-rhamnose isomerase [Candidatus Hydrogenedentota bacterium]HOS02444.1 L-rhamnose isomerase [Candidatus Hydrogenedentota bacterium]
MTRTDPKTLTSALAALEQRVGPLDRIKQRIKSHHIETPSWAYGDSGTRFKVFRQPGVPRTPFEKMEDAAAVHTLTGVAPSVAIHIPWDKVDDFGKLSEYANQLGVRIGAINPNLFQDDEYKLGSLTNESAAVRRKALDHLIECIEIGKTVKSDIQSLWFADGTNYPGQGDFRRRKRYLIEGLLAAYAAMPETMRMLIEYKFFEPAFYHTDIGDWGMSYVLCQRLGQRAQVLVDLGHHPLGSNIEHIVAFLIDEGKMGGFHFNNKKYADDDLTVGSINPFELFLIYNELVAAEDDPALRPNIAYMIDQSHNEKPKIEAMIQSVMNCQTAYARALLVDRAALTQAQQNGDIIGAEEVLQEAYQTDVRPLLAQVRLDMGIDPDPILAFRASGYLEKVQKERK